MSSVRVSCPSCKSSLKAGEKYLGRKVRCKKCGVQFRIAGDLQGTGKETSESTRPPGAEDEELDTAMLEEETPIPGALSLDDEPAPAVSAEPFAFLGESIPPATSRRSSPKNRGLPPGASGQPAPAPAKVASVSAAYRPRRSFDLMKVIVFAAVFAVIFGGIISGVLIYLKWAQLESATTASSEKEQEAPTSTEGGEEGATTAAGTKVSAVPRAATNATGPAGRSPSKPGMLTLPAGPAPSFKPMGKTPELVQKPEKSLTVETAFPRVRRAFPPLRPEVDPAILWQSAPGFQGIGEKLTLDLFSPQTGSRVNRLVVDGDGSQTPVCDLSISADLFALAHLATKKISIWNTRDGRKILDGFEPYLDRPEHREAGLAAIYLSEPPDRLVTVSTAGAVHVWDLASKKLLGEFGPPKGRPGSISAGKNVCPGPGRQSVVLVAGGSLYKVVVRPMVTGESVADLGGETGGSFGLAASGDGRVVYAFASDDGMKEKAVMTFRPDGNHIFHRWPESAGEPVSAGWCGDDLAAVASDRGAVLWFEAEGKDFRPLALVNTPGDKAIHVAADSHWSLLPDTTNPKLSIFVEYTEPQRGLIDPLEQASKRLALRLKLDDQGLFK